MSVRKYVSGYEKLKKRKKEEKLIESQKGSMNKFVKIGRASCRERV